MADEKDKDGGEDDIAARFARAQSLGADAAKDDLPPPPSVSFTRPEIKEVDPIPQGRLRAGGGSGVSGSDARGMGLAYTIGLQLPVSVIAGAGLGWLIDRYVLRSTGTPWGVIVGVLLGTVSGLMTMVKLSARLNRETEAATRESRGDRGGGKDGPS